MTANATRIISRLTPSDADELLQFIRQIQMDAPLRPVTIVGPSNYALLSLRHRLGLSGIANVRFMVFPRLAELLGAPSLSAKDKRPITPIINSAIVREVASEATGLLGPLRDHPSTHMSLRRTFRELRHASEDALDSLERQGGLRAETISLYRKYRQRTGKYYDDEDLAQAAAEVVRKSDSSALDDMGSIAFFRVRGLTPSQTLLVQALADAGRCAALLGLTGDEQADRATHALAGNLGSTPDAPQANDDAPAENSHLLIAPDAHQELRWVIRRIMQRAEDGTPFHRMAVLYRKEEPYGTLIREELDLAEIPVAGPNTASLADTAVGSTLTGLLGLQEADFARDAVMAWLTGSPLKPPPGIEAPSFNPTLWDTISKKAKVVRGADNWQQRLTQFAERQSEDAAKWADQGEMYEARVFRIRADVEVARQLLRFVAGLIEAATPKAGASWADYSSWAKDLLDSYLLDNDRLPPSDQLAYDRIERILEELRAADDISTAPTLPTFDVFRRALNEALQASVGHLGSVGQGVFVAPFRTAAAMSFDVVHLVGMIEGAVPPAGRDDPLIPERDRERAGGSDAGLPLQQQRKDDERYAYLAALATAPEHTLSYPVADPAGQRENFPSRWFLERASQLEGIPVFSSNLPQLSGRHWMTVITSMRHSLETSHDSVHADVNDYNLGRLNAWKSAGLRVDDHPLSGDGVLADSMRLGGARFGRQFTEWDGNLSAASADFDNMLTGRPQSPTSLERWAKCPFSYFLGSVLRLSAEDSPEDIYEIPAMERGLLVHEILEDFIDAVGKQGSMPEPQEEWSDPQHAELRQIADKHFLDAEARGITGKTVMWQIARDEILIDLEAFLDADSQVRQQFGVSPMLSEAEFGISPQGWQPADFALPDGTRIAFRGKIDRVDADDSGKHALVLDYKTGSSRSYSKLKDDPIDRGHHLQLAIYSLAARQALGDDTEVSAAYWFVTSANKFELLPSPAVNIGDESVMERFSEGMSTIVGGIRQGLFPANPGDPGWGGFANCRFCDFKTLCSSRRDVQWQRKSGATELADYVKLSEDEE